MRCKGAEARRLTDGIIDGVMLFVIHARVMKNAKSAKTAPGVRKRRALGEIEGKDVGLTKCESYVKDLACVHVGWAESKGASNRDANELVAAVRAKGWAMIGAWGVYCALADLGMDCATLEVSRARVYADGQWSGNGKRGK